jgi:CheY-like chemotaxis protein
VNQQGILILTVYDPAVTDQLAHVLITMTRYEVTTADSAFGAAEIVRRVGPRAVLLDIEEPAGPGIGVLDELEADARTANVPVVVVSALPERENEPIRHRAAAVLSRSLDAEQLLKVLRRVMSPQL